MAEAVSDDEFLGSGTLVQPNGTPNPAQQQMMGSLAATGAWDNSAPAGSPLHPFAASGGATPQQGQSYLDPSGQFQTVGDQDFLGAGYAPPRSIPASLQPKTDEGLGFYAGAMRPLDNSATWLSNAVRAIPGVGNPIANAVESLPTINIDQHGIGLGAPQPLDQVVTGHQQAIDDAATQGRVPGVLGQIAGAALTSAPALMGGPFVAGGIGGLLSTRNPNDLAGAVTDAATGAVGGKLVGGVLGMAGHALSPVVNKATQTLMDAGVKLSPGQIMGGGWRTIEDATSHIPGIGTAIKAAQGQATTTFNRAALNRALAPIGETLPDHVDVGNDAISYISDRLGQKYNELLPSAPPIHIDQPFVSHLADVYQNGVDGVKLAPAQQSRLEGIIKDTLFSRVADDGTITGKNLQAVDSTLGKLSAGYSSGQNTFDDKVLGQAVGNVQTGLRDLFGRANPQASAELSRINEGWANYARLRAAASNVGAKEGVFSAAQLQAAVKAGDKSAGKGDFAKGNALMQDLSAPGYSLLPSTVADSGTGARGLMDGAIIGMMSGHGAEHLMSPHVLLPAAALMAPYSEKGLPIMRSILAGPRGPIANTTGGVLRLLSRPAGVAPGLLGDYSGQR